MGYQDFEVQKEQHRLKNNNARGATLLKEWECEKNYAKEGQHQTNNNVKKTMRKE
jgi:hypothetical protein